MTFSRLNIFVKKAFLEMLKILIKNCFSIINTNNNGFIKNKRFDNKTTSTIHLCILSLFFIQVKSTQASTQLLEKLNMTENNLKESCHSDFNIIERIQGKNCETKNVFIFVFKNSKQEKIPDSILKKIINHKTGLVFSLSPLNNSALKLSKNSMTMEKSFMKNKFVENFVFNKKLAVEENIFKKDNNFLNNFFSNISLDTTLTFLIKNFSYLDNLYDTVLKYPNLIKIIVAYNECSTDELFRRTFLSDFMKKLWNENRVLNTYLIHSCLIDFNKEYLNNSYLTNYLYVYNPFERNINHSIDEWGALRKFNISEYLEYQNEVCKYLFILRMKFEINLIFPLICNLGRVHICKM